MSLLAVIQLLGGVRASAFAASAIALGIIASVLALRLEATATKLDAAREANVAILKANRDQYTTIEQLRNENKAWAKAADARKEQAAQAAETVAAERDALAAEREKRRRERRRLYEQDPSVAAWGRTHVPDSVARQLRE